jgi:hypothetical protein
MKQRRAYLMAARKQRERKRELGQAIALKDNTLFN